MRPPRSPRPRPALRPALRAALRAALCAALCLTLSGARERRPTETAGRVALLGALDERALPELSGLAVGDAALWAHNDSGGAPALFALDPRARLLARLTLSAEGRPVNAVDLEDLAVGGCPGGEGGRCLYAADVGDNTRARDAVTLYVAREPAARDLRDGHLAARPIRLRYPDGPANAEALVVDDAGARAWLFEKLPYGAERPARVWELDLRAAHGAAPLVAREVARLAPLRPTGDGRAHLVTAADLHPDGRRLLLRTYGALYELTLPAPYALHALSDPRATRPRLLATSQDLDEPQGEAAAYAAGALAPLGLGGAWALTASELGDDPRPSALRAVWLN